MRKITSRFRVFLWLLILCLAFSLLPGCGGGSTGGSTPTAPPTATNYTPWLTLGTKWGFSNQDATALASSMVVTQATLSSATWTLCGGFGYPATFTWDENGLYLQAGENETYNPPVKYIKYPLQSGDSWSGSGTHGGESYSFTAYNRGQEQVTTPAGIFSCWKIEHSISEGTDPSQSSSIWWSLGVGSIGMVKESGDSYSYYLAYYSVNGATGGTEYSRWNSLKVYTVGTGTYQVWGGNTLHKLPDGAIDYNYYSTLAQLQQDYTSLGSAGGTHTFNGEYNYYVVVCPDYHNPVYVDAFQGSDGRYLGESGDHSSNTENHDNIRYAPDGQTAKIGTGDSGKDFDGYILFQNQIIP